MKSLLLAPLFLLIFLGARLTADVQAQSTALARFQKQPEPGALPDEWIWGEDCDTEEDIQVHAYNEDFYILRQSKCTSFEAPFMYLIFGDERVVLFDTGATPSLPLRVTVEAVIDDWLAARGQASIDLIVAHTHSHFDHVQADFQFVDYAAEWVGPSVTNVINYYGLPNWPDDAAELDLGGRVLDIIPTPGHHPASISIYDRRTQLFLSGDIVYPGHLFIFLPGDVQVFVESLERMVAFANQNPIKWVLGCHVEMSTTPGVPYGYTTPAQPDEHVLEFPPTIFQDVLDAAISVGPDPDCTIFDEFVIHPVYKCGILWNG